MLESCKLRESFEKQLHSRSAEEETALLLESCRKLPSFQQLGSRSLWLYGVYSKIWTEGPDTFRTVAPVVLKTPLLATRRLSVLGVSKEVEKVLDVLLAGWAAEEAQLTSRRGLIDRLLPGQEILSSSYEIFRVQRARRDLTDFCEIARLKKYQEMVLPRVLQGVPHYPVLRVAGIAPDLGTGHYSSLSRDEQDELDFLVRLVLRRKEKVRVRYFYTRQEKMLLRALAREIAVKKALSGSEVRRTLERTRRSWGYKLAGYLPDFL